MAVNKSGSVIKRIADFFHIEGVEIPSATLINLKAIQPTFDVNALEPTVSANTSSSASGTLNLVTADSSKDFYITHIFFSMSNDAASDATNTYIKWYCNNKVEYIKFYFNASTARELHKEFEFKRPLKVDKGTTVQSYISFSLGTHNRFINVLGFYK